MVNRYVIEYFSEIKQSETVTFAPGSFAMQGGGQTTDINAALLMSGKSADTFVKSSYYPCKPRRVAITIID